MSDALTDLSTLQQWVKDQLFRRAPDPTNGNRTTGTPKALEPLLPDSKLPDDDAPGLGHSVAALTKTIFTRPDKILSAIGHHTTPSDSPDAPPGGWQAFSPAGPYKAPPSYVPTPPGPMSPPTETSTDSSGRIHNLLASLVPDAAKKVYQDQQDKATSPQVDAAGRQVVNHDTNILLPAVMAGAKIAYDLSPAENLLSILRGAKVDPTNGKEVPLTGEEVMGEMTDVAMKSAVLEKAQIKVPTLEELLGGSQRANLDPIVSRTRFQGEINSAIRAKEMNAEESRAITRLSRSQRETHGEDEDIMAGQLNLPLDAKGQAIAEETAKQFPQAHRIVTSDILRAMQTADPLTEKFPEANQEVNPAWNAMAKGMLEGQKTDLANKALLEHSLKTPDEPIPGNSPVTGRIAESWSAFTKRIIGAGNQALDDISRNPEATHVYFTHSDVIKGLQAHAENFGLLAPGDIDPQTFSEQTSGRPGSIFRYARDAAGAPKLFDVTSVGAEGPGAYIVRHGKTAWDPPGESEFGSIGDTSPIPRSLEAIEELRSKLPDYKLDQYLQPLPRISWIQDRVADWVFAPQFVDWMKTYDPANKDTNPFHEAAAQFLASPDYKSHVVADMEDHHGLSPVESRQLVAGEMDNAARYAGQTNKVFSDALKGFTEFLTNKAQQASTVGEAADANKLIKMIGDFRQRLADSNAGRWAKVNNVLNNVENLSRSLLVGSLDTAINIAKSHGLISLTDGADAINSSLISLITNSGKNITDALVNRRMPERPIGATFREDMGDGLSFLNAFTSRIPFIPDVVRGRVHWDPSAYGIDADTYNAIRKDAADGVPVALRNKGPNDSDLVSKYEKSGLDYNPGMRRQQIYDIVNGKSHRNIVDDLLGANPMGAGRVLGGFMHDIDSHLFGPQVSLLSKSLEQAMNAYKDEPSGAVAKAKAAWESGTAGLQETIKSLPFEAFWNKGGLKESIKAAGLDAFNGVKMASDFQNIFNRLQMYELSRFQYHMHFVQELNHLGMSEDEALAQMNNTNVQRNKETGSWEPVAADPRLREAAAKAELMTMKNTLRQEPQAGVLGAFMKVLRTTGEKFFPTTPFLLTFPRYVMNYMLFAASHSPTNLLQLFSKDFRDSVSGITTDSALDKVDVMKSTYGENSKQHIQAKSQAVAADDARVEAVRSLSRGMTGLGLTAVGYAMSQGHKVGGYTMGPKPYLLDNGTKDAQGHPKYLHVDTIGPVNFFLHLGHITDSLVNQKPINLNSDEWQDFISGAKTLDAPLFGLHDTITALSGDNPETKWQAAAKVPGQWLGRWTRFWKGGQDDAAALGINLPDREQHTDQYGQALAGPTLNNINPGALPARVNAFSGKLDIEEHPGQALFKSERRVMFPMEKWMTDLGIDTNTVTPSVHEAVANNELRQLSGLILSNPSLSRQLVQQATGIDMPLDSFVPQIEAALPQVGKNAQVNREKQQQILQEVLKVLHSNIKDIFMDIQNQKRAAGFPTPVLADEWMKQEKVLPSQRDALKEQLKQLGIR